MDRMRMRLDVEVGLLNLIEQFEALMRQNLSKLVNESASKGQIQSVAWLPDMPKIVFVTRGNHVFLLTVDVRGKIFP